MQRYTAMRDALAATGRPIVYSISEWGTTQPWNWAPAVGNLGRTTGDISDSWSAGNDLRSMSSATRTPLTNSEIIAVDQDPAGKQGTMVAQPSAGLQVWSKPVQNGVRVVSLLNRNGSSASITAQWSAIGIGSGSATVSVNGGAATGVTFPSTGSYTTPGTVTVNLSLQAGDNTVRFSNGSGWAPDIDRLIL